MPLFIFLYFYGEDTAFRWLIAALNSSFYPQSVIRLQYSFLIGYDASQGTLLPGGQYVIGK